MTIEAAETLALQTLKQVMEEKINSTNIEIATRAGAWRELSRGGVVSVEALRLASGDGCE